MSESRTEDEAKAGTAAGVRDLEGDARLEIWYKVGGHAEEIAAEVLKGRIHPIEAPAIWAVTGRKLADLASTISASLAGEGLRATDAEGRGSMPGHGSRAPVPPEESAEERSAAEAVDRMIAALDTATATVEAQLAELRRMRRPD